MIDHQIEKKPIPLFSELEVPIKPIISSDLDAIDRSFLDVEEKLRFARPLYEKTFVLPNNTFGNPEKDEEDFHIFLPFSDLNGWVYEKEMISKGAKAFSLWKRLDGINSLSHVSYVMTNPNGEMPVTYISLPETRLNHSFVVARTMEAIMRNNNFPEDDINVGIAAAPLHDRATPALGDATKSVDLEALNEEDFWWEGLDNEAWALLGSIGATRQMIDDIIHNRGVLGEILDIADKIGYVMLDLKQTGYATIIPDLGNIYKDVSYDQKTGRVYFKDAEKLRVFLGVRARLFTSIYISPFAQSTDYLMASLLKPFYSPTPNNEGRLTPQDLRQMKDKDLLDFLADRYGVSKYRFHKGIDWFPEYVHFMTEEEAEARAGEIRNDPELKLVGIKRGYGFNPATHFLTQDDENGEIMPFSQYAPNFSRGISIMAEDTRGYFVVYANREDPDLARFLPEV